MKSGNLDFLEPSGPLRACNGTDLPLPFTASIVLCYKSEGRWFDPSCCVGLFVDIKPFRSHYGPGVDSASNRNVPGVFPGGKGGRYVRLTTLPLLSCAVVMKSGNLNFLELSGPLQACNWTDFPFYITLLFLRQFRKKR